MFVINLLENDMGKSVHLMSVPDMKTPSGYIYTVNVKIPK